MTMTKNRVSMLTRVNLGIHTNQLSTDDGGYASGAVSQQTGNSDKAISSKWSFSDTKTLFDNSNAGKLGNHSYNANANNLSRSHLSQKFGGNAHSSGARLQLWQLCLGCKPGNVCKPRSYGQSKIFRQSFMRPSRIVAMSYYFCCAITSSHSHLLIQYQFTLNHHLRLIKAANKAPFKGRRTTICRSPSIYSLWISRSRCKYGGSD